MESISERVVSSARDLRGYTADTLSRLIRIPSPSGGEEKVCREIESMCRDAGFDDVRIDGLGNVIARLGSGKKILAFDAHVDTVGVGDTSQWKMDPFSGTVADGLVHGRGAADQKGGAAAMIAAGRILKDLGYDGPLALAFTFTVLEEDCDGLCWRWLIEKEGLVPGFAVSTEPTSCRLYRGQRGRMEVEVTLKGVSAHGSAPERGESAAYKAARAALAMEEMNAALPADDFLGKGTVTVSRMDARGPSLCAVPDQASVYLDRRLTWGETPRDALAAIRARLPEAERVELPRFQGKSWRGVSYGQELEFPAWKIPEDHPLVAAGVSAHTALFSRSPMISRWTFSTNCVAICGLHGIPCIGFGPGDEERAHAPNEFTRVDDLEKASAFYAMLPLALGEIEGR